MVKVWLIIACIFLSAQGTLLYASIKEWAQSRGEILEGLVRQQVYMYIDEADRAEAFGSYIDAIASLQKAYALDNRDVMVLERLGRIYHKVGKTGLAYAYLKDAIALKSKDINTYIMFAEAAQGREEIDDILETLYISLPLFEAEKDKDLLFAAIEQLANKYNKMKYLYLLIPQKVGFYMTKIDEKVDEIKDVYTGFSQQELDAAAAELSARYKKILAVFAKYPWAMDTLSYEDKRRLDQIALGIQLIGKGYKRVGIEKMLQSDVSLLKKEGLFE